MTEAARRAPVMRRSHLLLLAVAILPACIVPLSPDFRDPPAPQNVPPQLFGESPDFEAETTSSAFHVTVTDPNVGDDLFVRWYVDPGSPLARALFAPITIIPHRTDGLQQFTRLEATVDCARDFIPRGITRHRVVVMVGDRDFAPESKDLALLSDKTRAEVKGWTLDRQCPGDSSP